MPLLLTLLWCCICRLKNNPQREIHMRTNLEIAFTFMQDIEKLGLVNIGMYSWGPF